jgi:hypothetical protein
VGASLVPAGAGRGRRGRRRRGFETAEARCTQVRHAPWGARGPSADGRGFEPPEAVKRAPSAIASGRDARRAARRGTARGGVCALLEAGAGRCAALSFPRIKEHITMTSKQQGQHGSNEDTQRGRQASQSSDRGEQQGGRGQAAHGGGQHGSSSGRHASQGGQHGAHGGGARQSQQEDAGGGQHGGGRGFAGMDPQRQREIAAEGGRAAHASGHAHEFDSQEAREAGSHSHDRDRSGGRGGQQG